MHWLLTQLYLDISARLNMMLLITILTIQVDIQLMILSIMSATEDQVEFAINDECWR